MLDLPAVGRPRMVHHERRIWRLPPQELIPRTRRVNQPALPAALVEQHKFVLRPARNVEARDTRRRPVLHSAPPGFDVISMRARRYVARDNPRLTHPTDWYDSGWLRHR